MLNKPFQVEIRREHFTDAVTGCHKQCLIAQALIDHLGEVFRDHISVSGTICIGSLPFEHDGHSVMEAFDRDRLDPENFQDTKITLTPIKP